MCVVYAVVCSGCVLVTSLCYENKGISGSARVKGIWRISGSGERFTEFELVVHILATGHFVCACVVVLSNITAYAHVLRTFTVYTNCFS